jgi:hypothetical protein
MKTLILLTLLKPKPSGKGRTWSAISQQDIELVSECKSTHCFLHQDILLQRKKSAELNSVLSDELIYILAQCVILRGDSLQCGSPAML